MCARLAGGWPGLRVPGWPGEPVRAGGEGGLFCMSTGPITTWRWLGAQDEGLHTEQASRKVRLQVTCCQGDELLQGTQAWPEDSPRSKL